MTKYFLFFALLISIQCATKETKNITHNVYDYGATGDGVTNDQIAIQKAIDACKGTGGKVIFPEGSFLTGQLMLGNNMTLQLDSTATILGIQSDAEDAYPHHKIETRFPNRMLEDCQRRLIYGNHVKNVTITGKGKIDGQGDYDPWMNVKELGTEKDRPSILAFVGSKNITVSDITMVDPACWTQVYIESDSITIRNIKVHTGNLTPNRDGIDIVDCHKVLIEDCDIKSEDDGICFKSGSEYGCKDVVVRNCTIDKLNVNAGNCFKLGTDGLGSFMNFDISNLTLKNAFQNSAIVLESMDGAVIDNINISDCEISNCGQAVFMLLADRKRTVPGRKPRIGSISNIHLKNINGRDYTKQYPSIITGIEGHNIQNVVLENLNLQLKGGIQKTDQTVMEYDGKYPEGSKFGNTNAYAFYVRHADKVDFIGCKISAEEEDAREWLIQEKVAQLNIQ
ncbi:glycoside hydrolase family 28 protein [Pseudozobellia sp. WGM2]|uniref:glycoside hydrolase family 28 protein n=1 Tax=Pseudozobellia sp. WGM2 TaxID=2787625 RepID=UPI001AE072B3|nr:glycosyl hydrolase family 28 protein [Pseudozobellia sp. WGM2]